MTKTQARPGVLACAALCALFATLSGPPAQAQIDLAARGLAAQANLTIAQRQTLQRIMRASTRALASNPEDNAVSAVGAQSVSNTHNSALTKSYSFSSNAGSFTTSGGAATVVAANGNGWTFPVITETPSNSGNIGAFTNGAHPDWQAWGWGIDFETDSPSFEIQMAGSTSNGVRIAVDGAYISKSILNFISGSNYFAVTISGNRSPHHIHIESSSTATFQQVNVGALDTILPYKDQDYIRAGVAGNSYCEGQGSAYPGNTSFAKILGRLMGWFDTRQICVGSTDYVNTDGGLRLNTVNQVPYWKSINSDLATFDLIAWTGGYNDSSYSASTIQAAALAAFEAARAQYPNSVFFVFGVQAGVKGPDAGTLTAEGAIKAAVIQFNDPLTFFIPVSTDTSAWINGTGYQGSTNGTGNSDYFIYTDHTHPNDGSNGIAGATTNSGGHNYLARMSAKGIRSVLAGLAY